MFVVACTLARTRVLVHVTHRFFDFWAVHNTGQQATINMLQKDPSTACISMSSLQRWITKSKVDPSMSETRGRKVNEEFEIALLAQLIYVSATHAEGEPGPTTMHVNANAMFSYAVVQAEAQTLQKQDRWVQDQSVQELRFTNAWITRFMKRNCFKRLRVTTAHKKIPTQEEVRKIMQVIQQAQVEFNIDARWVLNLDEIGIFYGMAPQYIFAVDGARSGEVPAGDEKSRFTVELAATGDGNILPAFLIIKCSVPSGDNPCDLSSMRVIHNLHAQTAFNEKAGWTLKKWEGFKTIKRKKGGIPLEPRQEVEHSRWYLQHEDGRVVTCQPKAWMDTGGFAMYTDTVLVPWWEKQKTSWPGPGDFPAKRLLVVCDNASVHKAVELQDKLEQHGIMLAFLPPNMTAWLQPLDLVVCGLIKTL